MGYTHYWYQMRNFTDSEWQKISFMTNKIIEAAKAQGIELANGHGEAGTEPVIDADKIQLNGVDDDAHETLYLTKQQGKFVDYTPRDQQIRDGIFNFCKTARKPYDAVVVSILGAARRIAKGALRLSSDGDGAVFKMQFKVSVPTKKRCSLCRKLCDGVLAHRHQGEWIGDECCWDERLRASE